MDFSSIHNYYEALVLDYVQEVIIPQQPGRTEDFFLDVACYALSQLPARYMRHDVDMAFYMSPEEHSFIEDNLKKVVEDALRHIEKNFNSDGRNSVDYGENPAD